MSLFKCETKDEISTILCPRHLDGNAAKEFTTLMKTLSAEKVKAHIFDLRQCEYMGPEIFRPVIQFKQQCGSFGSQVFSINFSNDIRKEIQANGLDMVFNPMPNLDAILIRLGLKKAPAAPTAAGIEFVKPFLGAVQIAITTQANTPITGSKPYPKTKPYDVDISIAGVINLVSPQFSGSISLLFPAKVFFEIYTNMLGEPITSITKESEDAAAELLNIIFGLAKMKLNNEKGYAVQKAIPTVLVGDKIRVATSNIGSTIVLPFATKAGPFFVEVTFDQQPDGAE